MNSYASFADDLLIAVYENNGRAPQKPCPLRTIIADYGLRDHSNWLATVADEFAEKGYWTVEYGSGPLVHLTAEGIRHAIVLEQSRRPKTWIDHIKSFTRSDWIAFGALVVSAIALFR